MLSSKKKIFLLYIFILINCFNINNIYAKNINKKNKKIFLQVSKKKDNTNYYLTKEEEIIFKHIKNSIKNKQWFEAYKLEKKIQNEGFRKAINTYISLQKFDNMEIMSQQEIIGLIEFNIENYFLSNFENFNNKIEFYYLNNVIKYENVKEYFNKFKSKNIDIIIKLLTDEKNYIISSAESNKNKELLIINNQIKYKWINADFTNKEQDTFLKSFSDVINDDDLIKRAELLVFKKKYDNLKIITNLIQKPNYKILFESILKIENDNPIYINNILRDIPKDLRENEALLFTKLKYYRAQNKDNKAIEILLNIKGNTIFSQYWWIYRNIYARDLMKEKKYKKSYLLVSEYNNYKSEYYAESQWLSGWLSLRYLNNVDVAIKHLHNYYNSVSYPASVAKASYWLGRAYFEKGNEKDSLYWYEVSSKYLLTFYGQLSHYAKYNILTEKGEEYKDLELPTISEISKQDIKSVDENRIVKFAFLYYNYEGKRDEANNIFKELISKILRKKGEIVELIEIIETLDDEKMIIPLSRIASYRTVFFVDNLFPLLRMVKKTDENIALIHSIIKQESGFIIQAESNAGAIGFMQIMPATAKTLCKQLKITYNQYKLKNDPQYNIKLGNYYINQLIRQFRGSKILAIASYNAGPNATNRWIKDFGDPRETADIESVIDWMESITYKETRNYVQKILENLVVYEYRLGIN